LSVAEQRERTEMNRTFTGSEFSEALAAGNLSEPITRVGMAKPDDDDRNIIQFADGTNCSDWTRIPVAMIEKVEFIRNVPCRDHEHPLVAIELKSSTGDGEATVFAELLRNATPQAAGSLSEVAGDTRLPLPRRRTTYPTGMRRRGGGFGPVDPEEYDCVGAAIDRFFECRLPVPHCRLLLEFALDALC
jgi:hypothetical protein